MNHPLQSPLRHSQAWPDRAYWIACLCASLACLAAQFAAYARNGFWEDGYFLIRFARNFVKHGVFAWNVSEGPLYGMTSQVLQVVGTVVYWIAPKHVVLVMNALMSATIAASVVMLGWISKHQRGSWHGALPAVVALSSTLVLDSAGTGLETPLAILVQIGAIHAALAFRANRSRAGWLVAANVLVYLTRPDAILVQVVLLGVFALEAPRRYLPIALSTGAILALLLFGFHAYYGTTVPLATYLKLSSVTQLTPEYVALFDSEKTKNSIQFLFLCAPFVFIAFHERSREVHALCGAAAAFAVYHYFFTVEHMGHSSRYYLPALAPVLSAAALAFGTFRTRANWRIVLGFTVLYLAAYARLERLDQTYLVPIMIETSRNDPYLAAVVCLFFAVRFPRAALALVCTLLPWMTFMNNPSQALAFESDKSILLRQIAPRRTFRGLAELRERIPEAHAIFHHDTGAPGVLFPEAVIVDLDGILNERRTLQGATFEQLCQEYQPEVVFEPHPLNATLRAEVLASPCFANYRRTDKDPKIQFRIRRDLYARYMGLHKREPKRGEPR